MPVSYKTMDQIATRMRNRVVARSDLSDLTNTSSVNHVLTAAAREDEDAYDQIRKTKDVLNPIKATGPDLDAQAEIYNPDTISRQQPQYATGQVVFSRVGTTGDVTIPTGTEIKIPAVGAQAALSYYTTAEGAILDGNNDSAAVDIVAAEPGAAYRTDPGTITGFGSKPTGVDAVTNPAAIVNGFDLESDESFRKRIFDYVASLSRATRRAIESAARTDPVTKEPPTADGKTVAYVKSVEDSENRGRVYLYIDDGSGTAETTDSVSSEVIVASAVGGETEFHLANYPIKTEEAFTLTWNDGSDHDLERDVDYTLDPASGYIKLISASFPTGLGATDSLTMHPYTYFTGLIAEVQKVIDGDEADRANYPGVRAAGVLVRVLAPTTDYQVVTANITVRPGFNPSVVATLVVAAISRYINGLGIGEDVIFAELEKRVMSVTGMYDVVFLTPTENHVTLPTHLPRILSGNISIS
jgi:uncharacterized phage protein gp47/JayE